MAGSGRGVGGGSTVNYQPNPNAPVGQFSDATGFTQSPNATHNKPNNEHFGFLKSNAMPTQLPPNYVPMAGFGGDPQLGGPFASGNLENQQFRPSGTVQNQQYAPAVMRPPSDIVRQNEEYNAMPAQAAQAQPNIFDTSAQGMNRAIKTAGMETMYQPERVQAGTANAYLSGYAPQVGIERVGYNPITAERISADQIGSQNITADQIKAGQIAGTDLSAYMNPYESQVVGQSLSDLDRARQMQAMQLNAQAQKAGAFGGSRQALMQSELNRDYLDQAARTASGLRQAGFQNAQQLAGQDIATRMQADVANQGANLTASQANQNKAMEAALANQRSNLTAGQLNQSTGLTAAQANQNAGLTAGQANQNAALSAATTNANLGQAVNLANQNALNQTSQFNVGNQLSAALANQSTGLAGSANRQAAASNLGQLSNLGFGQGMQLTDQAMSQGGLVQGINQMLIDAAKGQYGGFTGAPADALKYLSSALGVTPTPTSTTQSRNPGLFDYLTLLSSIR